MNILTDRLPDSVTVGDKKYPLNTDFRNWIIAGHIADIQTGRREDILKILFLCYKKRLPPSISLARHGISDFYAGATGADCNKTQRTSRFDSGERLFDFYYDSKYIYSDFFAAYGIDLCKKRMHFYKFCTLFEGLPETARIVQIMKLRATDLSEIKSPPLRQKYALLKKTYSLRQYMPSHIKQSGFGEALSIFF